MWTAEAREQYKDDGRRYPSDLTDAEWATIEPLLSCYATLTAGLREMVNACLYLEKAGCPWRFLPKEFGPWQTVRTWHDRFRADGIWTDIAVLLTRAVRAKQGRKPEPATAIPRVKPEGRLWTAKASCPACKQARAAWTATRGCGASSATC
jgi:putative transposase